MLVEGTPDLFLFLIGCAYARHRAAANKTFAGIFSQVQLTRELLTGSGVKRKLQVLFEGHGIRNRIWG